MNSIFLNTNYKIRGSVYQTSKERLDLVYKGIAYSIGVKITEETKSNQDANEDIKVSFFVEKIRRQLGI